MAFMTFARQTANELATKGSDIPIVDFAYSYASLACIKQLPVIERKVDDTA
jgi:EAL domain-containing protein (putative c-di-GMP-specific phosphodiesterase class I)